MIFDSLTHPTLDGSFLGKEGTTFKQVAKELKESGYRKACAIGMPGIGKYSHKDYYQACKKYDVFYPVAAIDFNKELSKEIEEIYSIGYRAIKIHPRFLEKSFSLEKLKEYFGLVESRGIVTFLCTYSYSNIYENNQCLNFENLVKVLSSCKPTKIVLLHGGVVEVMKYAELVRHNPNLLLDLSLTILKYRKSSIDADIEFLFNHFDRRICIGTDYPDFNFIQLKNRVESLSRDLDVEKLENITYKNLENFLEI